MEKVNQPNQLSGPDCCRKGKEKGKPDVVLKKSAFSREGVKTWGQTKGGMTVHVPEMLRGGGKKGVTVGQGQGKRAKMGPDHNEATAGQGGNKKTPLLWAGGELGSWSWPVP